MSLCFHPYDQTWVQALRAGGPDDYGNPAERVVSDGGGNPCRSCLCDIAGGEGMLIAAACPFGAKQPYAETGPIFLHEKDCAPYKASELPPVLASRTECLIKAYGADQRIIYGSGQIVNTPDVRGACEKLLSDVTVAFVDVRSATNNCFTLRITRRDESWL